MDGHGQALDEATLLRLRPWWWRALDVGFGVLVIAWAVVQLADVTTGWAVVDRPGKEWVVLMLCWTGYSLARNRLLLGWVRSRGTSGAEGA